MSITSPYIQRRVSTCDFVLLVVNTVTDMAVVIC
jgi:hypothetical protein